MVTVCSVQNRRLDIVATTVMCLQELPSRCPFPTFTAFHIATSCTNLNVRQHIKHASRNITLTQQPARNRRPVVAGLSVRPTKHRFVQACSEGPTLNGVRALVGTLSTSSAGKTTATNPTHLYNTTEQCHDHLPRHGQHSRRSPH